MGAIHPTRLDALTEPADHSMPRPRQPQMAGDHLRAIRRHLRWPAFDATMSPGLYVSRNTAASVTFLLPSLSPSLPLGGRYADGGNPKERRQFIAYL